MLPGADAAVGYDLGDDRGRLGLVLGDDADRVVKPFPSGLCWDRTSDLGINMNPGYGDSPMWKLARPAQTSGRGESSSRIASVAANTSEA